MSIGRYVHRIARRARRRLWELCGSTRFSRPALHELDRKLERHLDFNGGVFIEAGANDGYEQSNTYYFEAVRGWTGLLIEPVPELAGECRRNRRARVVQAALTDRDVPGATVPIHFAGLMSTVDGALGDSAATARHVASGVAVQELGGSYRVDVPARALSSLIDESGIGARIDLLSLDVEGAEPVALRGLDLSRHRPRFICVEARDQPAIDAILQEKYDLRAVLSDAGSYRDLLYALRR